MSKNSTLEQAPVFEERPVRLGDLGIAPENPRAKEPADDNIPQLAETVAAAGIIERLMVRPGRKGERPFMVLNGRRRLLSAEHLLSAGRIDQDLQVPCSVAMNKAAELASIFLPTEQVPLHIADIIVAVGRLRKAKLDTGTIAKALGYDELEIRRLMALSTLHPKAIKALRQGRINMKTARLLARLKDQKEQASLAEQALMYGISEYTLKQKLTGGQAPISDVRFGLVGGNRYAAAGGRVEKDLFGELEDTLLDPEILQSCWKDRVQPVVEALQVKDVAVFITPQRWWRAPDGYEALTHTRRPDLTDEQAVALIAAEENLQTAEGALSAVELSADEAPAAIAAVLTAHLDVTRAIFADRQVTAAVIYPCEHGGVDVDFAAAPLVIEEEGASDEDDGEDYEPTPRRPDIETPQIEVDVEGRSHVLHETYTDVATRGLIRDLADNPSAALTALIAHLFRIIALQSFAYSGECALTIKADRYGRTGFPPIAVLDGEVRERLRVRRQAYIESNQRPIPWVESLPHGEKMALLAELVALTLDLREQRTTNLKRGARVEAGEIAELTGYDIRGHWTPDEAFLKVHGKKQLMGLLAEMRSDDAQAKTLKKDELVVFVGEQAAARQWAPEALAWPMPTSQEAEPQSEVDTEPEAAVDDAPDGDGDPLDGAVAPEVPTDLAA